MGRRPKREEHLHHAGEEESKEGSEQNWAEEGEILALLGGPKGVARQRGNNGRGQNQRLQHNFPVGVSAGDSHGGADGDGEESEEDVIMRMLLLVLEERNQKYEGKEEEEEKEGGISLEEMVDGRIENGDERDERGEEDLSGEDAVDLADEAPSELILAGAEAWVEGFA